MNKNNNSIEERRRILYTIGRPETGGVQKLVFYLTQSTELKGYDHIVMCLRSSSGGLMERFLTAGVPVKSCVPMNMSFIPSYRLRHWLTQVSFCALFKSLLRSLKPHLIHINNNSFLKCQLEIATNLGIPWVWTVHGLLGSTWIEKTLLDAVKSSPAGSYFITGVSHAALDNLDLNFIPNSRKAVVYNGIDLEDYISCAAHLDTFRNKWGIPKSAIVFGSAGRLIPLKRYDLLIDAAAKLKSNGLNAYFVIAGEGPLEHQIRKHVRDRGLEEFFRLVGWQSDIRPFLGAIDVFVLTSDTEGFSVVLLEACAAGKPCIASCVGGVSELLDGAGLLVSAGVLDEFVDALSLMLSSEVRDIYSARARQNSLRFSITKTAFQYAEIYRDLINNES